MRASPDRSAALGFSPEATPLLRRLESAGIVGRIRWPGAAEPPTPWLQRLWPEIDAVVAVGACGLMVRLIAPLLGTKAEDPAVVVLDPQGRFAVPLLGGHGAGGEALAQELAALLGGEAAITGSATATGRLALDGFGEAWGWRRGSGDWTSLLQAASRASPGLALAQASGLDLWRELPAAQPKGNGEAIPAPWAAVPNPAPTKDSTAAAATPQAPHGDSTPPSQRPVSDPARGSIAAAASADPIADAAAAPAGLTLHIDHRMGEGCRWHPPVLWLGLGCERHSSESLLERLVVETLAGAGLAEVAVAGLASAERKGDEPALLALAERRGWPLRLFSAEELAAVAVPNPSAAVARELGTASVAEASALLAARAAAGDGPEHRPGPDPGTPGPGPGTGSAGSRPEPGAGAAEGRLLVEKRIGRAGPGERGAATLAVALASRQWAPQRGELHLVGSGPGPLELLSGDARQALARASVWVGYSLYLDLLEPLRHPDQLRREGRLTAERDRCLEALDLASQGLRVALISSGDSGIYGMAGLALELWLARPAIDRPALTVHPGISALQLAAARVGAPLMHDFCTVSLSDRLTPWAVIERRLRAAAAGDFVVALYNPRSAGRDWQLERARTLLLEGRPASTPVAVARQLGRSGEQVTLHTLGDLPVEAVDMLTLVLVGNSTTRLEAGRMVTPRGYPGASLA
jgi:cobalt-precorrin 5A hydrolase/precorrin-3B C17-methyltransferase